MRVLHAYQNHVANVSLSTEKMVDQQTLTMFTHKNANFRQLAEQAGIELSDKIEFSG